MSSDPIPAFPLSNGTQIPWLQWGNGTGDAQKQVKQCGPIVLEVLPAIDTAQGYFTEQVTGEVIAKANRQRSSTWLTTKLSQPLVDGKRVVGIKGPPTELNDLRASIQSSIDKLGTQPDLLLVHNPFVVPSGQLRPFWQLLESLVDSGELTSSLGVSNFRPQDLTELLSFARIKPVVHQLEFHPWLLAQLDPILAIHEQHGIRTSAYGPLVPVLKSKTGGTLLPVLERIAKRLAEEKGLGEMDPATVLLLWNRAKGVVVVTSSGKEERIRRLGRTARLAADLLTKEDVEEIDAEGRKVHFRYYTTHMTDDFPAPDLPENI